MWARALNTLLGLWLMAAPAVLGYAAPAANVDRILGPVAASFAIIAFAEATRPVRHANLLIGALLVLAPLPLGYPLIAAANSIVCGLVMMALSRVRGSIGERFGGGWSKVWTGYGSPDE